MAERRGEKPNEDRFSVLFLLANHLLCWSSRRRWWTTDGLSLRNDGLNGAPRVQGGRHPPCVRGQKALPVECSDMGTRARGRE